MTNINDAVERVKEFCDNVKSRSPESENAVVTMHRGGFEAVRVEDIRTILAELERNKKDKAEIINTKSVNRILKRQIAEAESLRDSIVVLEYATNHIPNDKRRGIFISAFVEGEEWAVRYFEEWKSK